MGEAAPQSGNGRWLALIGALALLAALKVAAPVAAPLAFALFLIVLAWPLLALLERHLPARLAYTLTLLAVLAVFGGFVWALAETADAVLDKAPQYADRWDTVLASIRQLAEQTRLPVPRRLLGGEAATGELGAVVQRLAAGLFEAGGLLVAMAGFLVLGLLDVKGVARKAEEGLSRSTNRRLAHAAGQIVAKFQRYTLLIAVAAAVTGLLTGLTCWAFGLDFPFLWGFLAFALNFIPTIGSVVSVAVTVAFALFQLADPVKVLALFAVLTVVEVGVGGFVAPLIEGRGLSLSPFVVLVSVVFWGWMWGILGALLGVPITLALLLTADAFPATRWIAEMLAETPAEQRSADASAGP